MDHTHIGNRLLWETVQRQLITGTQQDYSYHVDRNDTHVLLTQERTALRPAATRALF